jgi:hypothetical protein
MAHLTETQRIEILILIGAGIKLDKTKTGNFFINLLIINNLGDGNSNI